jgi:hypothetical protein
MAHFRREIATHWPNGAAQTQWSVGLWTSISLQNQIKSTGQISMTAQAIAMTAQAIDLRQTSRQPV